MTLPTGRQERKDIPIVRGCLDYFPDALVEVARLSQVGNDQHNPGEPLHWAKEKSTDEADALLRHLIDRGTIDTDGIRHSAKVAWRGLALLQRELDAEQAPRTEGGDIEALERDQLAPRFKVGDRVVYGGCRGGEVIWAGHINVHVQLDDGRPMWFLAADLEKA